MSVLRVWVLPQRHDAGTRAGTRAGSGPPTVSWQLSGGSYRCANARADSETERETVIETNSSTIPTTYFCTDSGPDSKTISPKFAQLLEQRCDQADP